MNKLICVDSTGEIKQSIRANSLEDCYASVPTGMVGINDEPGSNNCYYSFTINSWVTKNEQPSTEHIWNVDSKQWEDPRTLADLKKAVNSRINTARLSANQSGFTHLGKLFATDPLSRSDIDGINGYVTLYGALPTDWAGAWKAEDNTYLPIEDLDAWKAFYGSMVATGNANFAISEQLKLNLKDATTAEEVEAIVWPT